MSRFDLAISVLNDMAEATNNTEAEVSCWDAIRVLEAAGKVDKEAWKYIIANLDSCRPSFVEIDQMGTLLSALPDREGHDA